MKEITKLDKKEKIECDKCDKPATTRIKTQNNIALRLCSEHQEEYVEKLREKIRDKFEGMDKDEIAKKVFQDGESLL